MTDEMAVTVVMDVTDEMDVTNEMVVTIETVVTILTDDVLHTYVCEYHMVGSCYICTHT